MNGEGIIEWKVNDLSDEINFSLFDIQGQEVMKAIPIVAQKTKINTEDLPSGIYFYKVIHNLEVIAAGRVVLE